MDCPCYPDLASVPEPVDCVVLAVPNRHVPDLLESAADAGVRAAVVFAAGLRGNRRAKENSARRGSKPCRASAVFLICGPNCYGVLNVYGKAPLFASAIPGGISCRSRWLWFPRAAGSARPSPMPDAQPPRRFQSYRFLRQSSRRDGRGIFQLFRRRRKHPGDRRLCRGLQAAAEVTGSRAQSRRAQETFDHSQRRSIRSVASAPRRPTRAPSPAPPKSSTRRFARAASLPCAVSTN